MKNIFTIFTLFVVVAAGCNDIEGTTIKTELLNRWSSPDSHFVDLLNFKTISEFDKYQYKHKELFDSIKVILSMEGYNLELVGEGNRLKNDLDCILPLPEHRIIRFQFTESGEEIEYNGGQIKPEQSKEITIERLSKAEYPKLQVVSLVFEDSIKPKHVRETVNWINEGMMTFATGGISLDSILVNPNRIEHAIKPDFKEYRLILAIGKSKE